jgi:hypothetical protein
MCPRVDEGLTGLAPPQMILLLKFVRVLALGAWVGAIVYFAAVVTAAGFAALASPDEAGVLVGFTLGGLHRMGLVLAALFVIASVALAKSLKAWIDPAMLGVILMALLTMASQYQVMPRLVALRDQMVSVAKTPSSDPRRAEFDRLHSVTVDLEGAVLMIGLIALFLTVREDQSPA